MTFPARIGADWRTADTLPASMRALVVSNMEPSPDAPQRGSFIRDQVAALRELGVEVDTFDWLPGTRRYPGAVRRLRRLLARQPYDVVHAHFGLAGACAAAAGAKPLVVTYHGTDVRHPLSGLVSRRLAHRDAITAAASRALFEPEGGRPGLPRRPGRAAVLPCGIDVERFRPIPPPRARAELGLDPDGRYLLFPASPARPVKRHDRAAELARRVDATLLVLGATPPAEVPLWVNAASAVVITSDNEGFGMAAVEALACQTPVLSTPVGAIPFLLAGLPGCHVGAFDAAGWEGPARACLDGELTPPGARHRALAFGTVPLAERVLAVYEEVSGRGY